ncbi:methionyl-tRNA formyltransferase [Okibacterium endophyticum]
MRLIFAGTPDVALPALNALAAGAHDVIAVVTREDAPQGRKRTLTPSPVAAAAASLGIRVIKANRLDGSVTAEINALNADLGVIVAYGGLVREPLLSTPRLGWINLHFSLLPAWRGAAPVQHSLIAGDTVTGASVFRLVPELDAGDVLGSERLQVAPDATAGDVLRQLAESGAALLAEVVDGLAEDRLTAIPQAGEPSFAPKLRLDDARLDLTHDAESVYNRFRGVTPEPGAFVLLGESRLKIHEARPAPGSRLEPGVVAKEGSRVLLGTSTHALELITVQPAGRGRMPAADWWRGQQTSQTAQTQTAQIPQSAQTPQAFRNS